MNDLGRRVRQARRMTGQNQADFAAAVGVSRSAVANWETGNGVPDMPNMIRIAVHSGMGFEYLATGRNEQQFPAQHIVRETEATYGQLTLDASERALVLAWRKIDEQRRSALLLLLGAAKGADP